MQYFDIFLALCKKKTPIVTILDSYVVTVVVCWSIGPKKALVSNLTDKIHKSKLNQVHAVSRTQKGRQKEPSFKALRSPLSAEFWRHCELTGRTQRRA